MNRVNPQQTRPRNLNTPYIVGICKTNTLFHEKLSELDYACTKLHRKYAKYCISAALSHQTNKDIYKQKMVDLINSIISIIQYWTMRYHKIAHQCKINIMYAENDNKLQQIKDQYNAQVKDLEQETLNTNQRYALEPAIKNIFSIHPATRQNAEISALCNDIKSLLKNQAYLSTSLEIQQKQLLSTLGGVQVGKNSMMTSKSNTNNNAYDPVFDAAQRRATLLGTLSNEAITEQLQQVICNDEYQQNNNNNNNNNNDDDGNEDGSQQQDDIDTKLTRKINALSKVSIQAITKSRNNNNNDNKETNNQVKTSIDDHYSSLPLDYGLPPF